MNQLSSFQSEHTEELAGNGDHSQVTGNRTQGCSSSSVQYETVSLFEAFQSLFSYGRGLQK